jgi:hypothetical protein
MTNLRCAQSRIVIILTSWLSTRDTSQSRSLPSKNAERMLGTVSHCKNLSSQYASCCAGCRYQAINVSHCSCPVAFSLRRPQRRAGTRLHQRAGQATAQRGSTCASGVRVRREWAVMVSHESANKLSGSSDHRHTCSAGDDIWEEAMSHCCANVARIAAHLRALCRLAHL